MTQDEINQMVEQAGFHGMLSIGVVMDSKQIEAFAALVAAKEREACAKKCETVRETIWEFHEEHLKAAACNVCTNLAIAIRARGEA